MSRYRGPHVRRGVRFALFASSYTPFFLLIILRQLIENSDYLRWGGLHGEAIWVFVSRFGLSIFVGLLMLSGLIMLALSLSNLRATTATNGATVTVTDVRNRNAESVSYIGTYIIPFLFESVTGLYAMVAVGLLLVVIYFIYVNSTLLLINPVLNLWYSLYEIEFLLPSHTASSGAPRTGMIVIKDKYLEEKDDILLMKIGQKLYFGVRDDS